MALLERDSTGILRHEAMPELNPYTCLRALRSLPKALAKRAAAGTMYRQLLSCIPGIRFQEIPDGMGTNHYQVSFRVDATVFGVSAKLLCQVLRAENVRCSPDRMPCVAASPKFKPYGRIAGDIKHSQSLATTSVTLPISNSIELDTVDIICRLIGRAHWGARHIVKAGAQEGIQNTPDSSAGHSIDLESKYYRQLIVPVLDGVSLHSKIIVPYDCVLDRSISIDELLAQFTARNEWHRGECVVQDLIVDAIVEDSLLVILAPQSMTVSSATSGRPVALDESGSSASVTLVPGANGKLIVRKPALGYGTDGNGAPWLRRQSLFPNNSLAVKKTNICAKQPIRTIIPIQCLAWPDHRPTILPSA